MARATTNHARPRKRAPNATTTVPTLAVVAHHEAGHFVAAYFQGMGGSVAEVTIAPFGDAAGRNAGEHLLGDDWSLREVQQLIIVLYAGYAAEVRFAPGRADGGARVTARDDDAKAAELLPAVSKGTTLKNAETWLREKTEALIDEHWPCVVALASELKTRTSLDRDEATWIVAIAEGERARKELGGYRTQLDAYRSREAPRKAPSVKRKRAQKAAK